MLAVCRLVRDAGGRAWLVGGGVRDAALGLPVRDADLEVFGLAPDRLQAVVGGAFDLELVGRAFGILKLKGLPVDVGLPRRETKTGAGHRGFAVTPSRTWTCPRRPPAATSPSTPSTWIR